MSVDEFDDLIGGTPTPIKPKAKVGRKTLEEKARLKAAETRGIPQRLPDMEEFYRPVAVSFLADVFRMDTRTVKKKLAMCPPIDNERGQMPRYDFVQAAGYLVKPRVDIAQWIKSQRVQDLPPHLAPGVQQAMLHRQLWEQRAGLLWRIEDVVDVLGDVFMTIKDRMQLWTETLSENTELTPDQYARMVEMVDALQADIHSKLVEMPQRRQTLSSLASQDAQLASMAGEQEFDEDEDFIG